MIKLSSKQKLKISLILNIIIVIMTIFAFVVMFMDFKFMPGTETTIASSKVGRLRFFTIDSNLLMGISALVFLIEEIKMPLMHILRNSVSHGIEFPIDRIKQGKDEVGIIRLTSKQEENNVIISIEDDGYGVNFEKVKETALKKGLLTQEEISNMDSKQLLKLLFFPGFSTEEAVTEISGRGIGLDIVKNKIANLNGEIFIDSVLNKGCKVTIRLPLSMSTIKTFIILVNNQKYAIPVNTIKYVTRITKDKIQNRNGVKSIIFDNHSIPIYYLSDILEKNNNNEEENQLTVIIIENHEKQAAYIIDKLLGDQEVFQKKLMPPIIKIKNISGFTILPTGEICLIINPYELIRNTN